MGAKYDRSKVFSYSNMETFFQCPYAFQQLYLLAEANGFKPLVSPQARRGSTFHKTATEFLNNYFDCIENEYVVWPNVWQGAKDRAIAESPAEDANELREIYKAYERKHSIPPIPFDPKEYEFLGTEVVMFLDDKGELIEDYNQALVALEIDLLYGNDENLFVYDWKTTQNPDLTIGLEYNHQMMIYSYAASMKYSDIPTIIPQIDYVRMSGIPSFPFSKEQVRYDVLPWLVQRINRIMDAIEKDDFPTNPNENCRYCGAREICPYYQSAITYPSEVRITSYQDAVDLAKNVWAAEGKIKEIKEQFRQVIEEWGPLIDSDSGKVLKLCPNPRYEGDIQNVIQVILDMDLQKDGRVLDIDQIVDRLSISKTKATEIIQDFTSPRSPNRKDALKELDDVYKKVMGNPKMMWRKEKT